MYSPFSEVDANPYERILLAVNGSNYVKIYRFGSNQAIGEEGNI